MVFGQARQVKNHLDRGDLDRSGQLGRILNKRRRNLDRAGLDRSQHLGRKGDEQRPGNQDRDNATGRFRTRKRVTGIMYPGGRDHHVPGIMYPGGRDLCLFLSLNLSINTW
ncbi:Uncharacterized protein Rs2_44364 [Raphanus sativus]|nr:Uncharacterized protein Rs2_44364 [Raphanus sativus]